MKSQVGTDTPFRKFTGLPNRYGIQDQRAFRHINQVKGLIRLLKASTQPLRMPGIAFTEGRFYQPRSARCVPTGHHLPAGSIWSCGTTARCSWSCSLLQGVVAPVAKRGMPCIRCRIHRTAGRRLLGVFNGAGFTNQGHFNLPRILHFHLYPFGNI